ncbi:BON domain-containing protein [Luteimonas sp. SDU82]|uniref:BON domain-containing protein n=1 Tax=Luteimonas sp. SDU82 TaxID=3422592 RepID=UPI003EB7DC7C
MADRDPRGSERQRRRSWLDDSDTRRRDSDDDYTRQLADRYGHGQGGYDRGAYPQGGYGESTRDHGGLDRDGPRGVRGKREADSSDGDFRPRRSYRGSEYTPEWSGDDRFTTGVFGGGADQDFRSGGQYQGESGRGAQPAYGGDFAGGGYLGRGGGAGPRHEARSGGAFGDNPRGWYGPDSASRHDQDDQRRGGDSSRQGGGFRGRGPKNYLRSDQRITEDLCERLTHDDDVDASNIEVEVKQGVVTLSGTVGERWMKHRAEDLAERCGGVRDVENRIRVLRDGGDWDSRGNTGGATR